jgi:hypothetical protein
MTRTPEQKPHGGTPITPEARDRLAALRERLAVCGYVVELDEAGLSVVAPVDHGMRLADKITVRPRPSDGDRAWFWTAWNEPIAPADRVIDAQVVISGYLRPRS